MNPASLSCAFLLLLPTGSAAARITVAAAANVRFALEEIKAAFTRESGIEVKAVYGASGKLAAQIRNGAPFDVFVSADMDFPDTLHKGGQASAKPRVYAYGKLVLWTLEDLDLGQGLPVLLDSGVTRIALADPRRAPYGREAMKVLKRAGLEERAKAKLVFGENISQVTQFVLTGNVEIGFTAKSVVLAGETRGKGRWVEVDSTLYDPIAQGAAVCRFGAEKHPASAERFHAYLYAEPARRILARHGYGSP